MGILNEFDAINIRYSESENSVYLLDSLKSRIVYRYQVHCKHKATGSHAEYNLHFFFDFDNKHCLVVTKNAYSEVYHCWITRFSVVDDLPVLSADLFTGQREFFINSISDEFKQKYAAIVLDELINS